ncbi:MAG: hypothetical protein DMG28_01260 [Acidobacteria bacterium]|nr:MAG: hypothetical protein DMG28_01260 [Acidobacteriota bacterium]
MPTNGTYTITADSRARTFTIAAGSKPIYEVEKSEDGTKVTIRYAENPEKKVEVAGSAIPDLIKVLQELGPYR